MIRRRAWSVAGVAVGLVLALVLVIGVEAFSSVVLRFPPG